MTTTPSKTTTKRPTRYRFTESITTQLEHYKRQLKEQGVHPDTLRVRLNYTGLLLQWMEEKKKEIGQTGYTDMVELVGYCRSLHLSDGHINKILWAARQYFRHAGLRNNPAAGLVVKNVHQKAPGELLTRKEMEELYHRYRVVDERTQRNKVITGLLIWQGLTVRELHLLEPQHVRLQEGTLYVPGGHRGAGRTLRLEGMQMMELQEYVHHTRGKILEQFAASRPGRKAERVSERCREKLFMSMSGSENLKPGILHLLNALRKINPRVRDARQLRQSVIAEWLKEKDLRVVQHQAGHRKVKSTERYQDARMEELSALIDRHHPLQEK
jgi:integrase/recombinase XerD